MQVFVVGDRAFDQDEVHAFGILLDVGQRAEDDVDHGGEVDQPFVQVEERHVATGTAAEPDCGEFQTTIASSPARDEETELALSFSISATVAPCAKKAPGRTRLHAFAARRATSAPRPRADSGR